MSALIVGIGDCKLSNNPEDTLVTHALGSCIGITVHDPVAKIAGLLHYMLPEACADRTKAVERPYMFADTGIPLLVKSAMELGAARSRLVVMAAGGAQMLDPNGTFNIGQRNQAALRKLFWKLGLLIRKEDLGGNVSRTMRMEVGSGRVQLRKPGEPEQEMTPTPAKIGAGNGLQHSHR